MASLRPRPKTERVYLPSTADLPESERGWVDIKDRIELGDIAAISALGLEREQLVLAGIVRMIVDWNIVDDSDLDPETQQPRIAPINMDTVNRLDPADFPMLSQRFDTLYDDSHSEVTAGEKKTLSVSSLETETPIPTPNSQQITPPTP